MFYKFLLTLCFLNLLWNVAVSTEQRQISYNDACAELQPAENDSVGAKKEGLAGRVLTGYQGWFRAEGDGSGLGFLHYGVGRNFGPGCCTIDLWPDLTEFDADELFDTAFKHRDGRTAKVFSSIHPKTINRHFSWMVEYGIDGPFVQRFAIHASKPQADYRELKFENRKLTLCRDAAIKHDRCWALMYDLSGIQDEDFERLARDWKELRQRMRLGNDPNDSSYLQFKGKPLIAVWGIGFADDRRYGLEKTAWFLRFLKDNPDWGGMSIMLGVPYYWRERNRDAIESDKLLDVMELADVISPWSVGRYKNTPQAMSDIIEQQRADLDWCEQRQITYLPVIWPGFSWQNMYEKNSRAALFPRDGGKFLWRQFKCISAAGGDSAYVAMFDEIDEGTAIFKCTNEPPVGKSVFQTFDTDPSDHYLWLVGEGGRLLRDELPRRCKTNE